MLLNMSWKMKEKTGKMLQILKICKAKRMDQVVSSANYLAIKRVNYPRTKKNQKSKVRIY